MGSMSERWARHVRPEHFDWTLQIINGLYHDPKRVYHTRSHIDACLNHLDDLDVKPEEGDVDRRLAELALIWHDAVYLPGHPDNEMNSLALLEGLRFTLKVPHRASEAVPCIMATRHKAEEGAFGDTTVAAVVDIDLAVLGLPSFQYGAYVINIRREFSHVSDEAWRAGRSGFLTQMLNRKRIYQLEHMRSLYEVQARENMVAELKALQ
jgi:predicted metal-dependent HD superfamily phosphohydrolase